MKFALLSSIAFKQNDRRKKGTKNITKLLLQRLKPRFIISLIESIGQIIT